MSTSLVSITMQLGMLFTSAVVSYRRVGGAHNQLVSIRIGLNTAKTHVESFLAEFGYSQKHLASWVMLTGGPKFRQASASASGLENFELAASWDWSRRTGNLSPASVLVLLEEVMKHGHPAAGTLGLLSTMGPGFCSELVALEW